MITTKAALYNNVCEGSYIAYVSFGELLGPTRGEVFSSYLTTLGFIFQVIYVVRTPRRNHSTKLEAFLCSSACMWSLLSLN